MGRRSQGEKVCASTPFYSPLDTPHTCVLAALNQRRHSMARALDRLTEQVDELSQVVLMVVETLRTGHKVLVVGNGGSAAGAQHFASELVGRFKRERAPYAVLSLATDTAVLTALSSDYGYEDVFARQVQAFGQPGDLLLAFSTSGESENLVRAACMGQQCRLHVLAFTGERTSRLANQAHIALHVPETDTAMIQELHMILIHLVCDLVESQLMLDD